jgi:hypothetical protein
MNSVKRWFATADDRMARLLHIEPVPQGRRRVHEHAVLNSSWSNARERGRPTFLGRGPSANATQHFAAPNHAAEEDRRRFAREVRDWLATHSKTLGIDQLTIFSPATMLGVLRKELDSTNGAIELREGELASLRTDELATHPAIESLLKTTRTGGGR